MGGISGRGLRARVESLNDILNECVLCPRRCRAKRTSGERGFCGLGTETLLARALPHFGEEPPISGKNGAGTLFFASCNLKCIYCQNHQISHSPRGSLLSSAELAGKMLHLQSEGCHNIEAVTPTPHLPQFVESLYFAREAGLQLPVVFNCGGYEEPQIIRLLDGIVDVYLPDFKYGREETAAELSGAPGYPGIAIAAIREMIDQVGSDLELDGALARRGIIIRHLVLPGMTANSLAALELLGKELSVDVPISLMAQYTPTPAMARHPALGRRLTALEYEYVLDKALQMGFGTIFTQEVDERHMSPDFGREEPFAWG